MSVSSPVVRMETFTATGSVFTFTVSLPTTAFTCCGAIRKSPLTKVLSVAYHTNFAVPLGMPSTTFSFFISLTSKLPRLPTKLGRSTMAFSGAVTWIS